jgi:D-alanine-D-alanine ligase
MKKLRVLMLIRPPRASGDVSGRLATATEDEHDVTTRSRLSDVHPSASGRLIGIRQVIRNSSRIAFNLLEAFHEVGTFDQNVVSYLELLRVPYTGCNPRGLILARDKSLSKKLFAYHRIPVPDFAVFRRGRAVTRPKRLEFPLIVKSLTQEASIGISQASVVGDEDKLRERVKFIHESVGTDAIIERYIDGRELYVGVMGNDRLQAFPVWELRFTRMPEDQAHRHRTREVEPALQKKHGINREAADLPPEQAAGIQHSQTRHGSLELSGYARGLRRARRRACMLSQRIPDRAQGGLRGLGRARRRVLSRSAPAHPQRRAPVAAGSGR